MNSEMLVNMVLDVILIALLVATLFYCWRLNKRVEILRDNEGNLSRMIARFDLSTDKAQKSIRDLQLANKEMGESMQQKFDKANFLADDLAFLIEKGNKVADRMEGKVREHRQVEEPEKQAKPVEKVVALKESEQAIYELDEILPAPRPARSSIEQLAAAHSTKADERSAKMRSRAEQALFEAIQSGRKA